MPDQVIKALATIHQADEQTPIDPAGLFSKGDPVQFVDGHSPA